MRRWYDWISESAKVDGDWGWICVIFRTHFTCRHLSHKLPVFALICLVRQAREVIHVDWAFDRSPLEKKGTSTCASLRWQSTFCHYITNAIISSFMLKTKLFFFPTRVSLIHLFNNLLAVSLLYEGCYQHVTRFSGGQWFPASESVMSHKCALRAYQGCRWKLSNRTSSAPILFFLLIMNSCINTCIYVSSSINASDVQWRAEQINALPFDGRW